MATLLVKQSPPESVKQHSLESVTGNRDGEHSKLNAIVQSSTERSSADVSERKHWLHAWLHNVVTQTIKLLVDNFQLSSSLIRLIGFPTQVACAVHYYLIESLSKSHSSNQSGFSVCFDNYLIALRESNLIASDRLLEDDRVNSVNLARFLKDQGPQFGSIFPRLTQCFTQSPQALLSSSEELELLAELYHWLVNSRSSDCSLVPLQTVTVESTKSDTHSNIKTENALSIQGDILKHLMRNTATVARPARPAHPKGRPVALLNTSAVEQLVASSSTEPKHCVTPTASVSHTSGVDVSKLQESCSTTDSELLTNLAHAAIHSSASPAHLEPDSSSTGGYYVTERCPESGSPPELAPIKRGKMYATFRKFPSPAVSNRLPVISSPGRVVSPSVSNEDGVLFSGRPLPSKALPSLRSAFEGRRRSRSMLPSQQTKSVECPPGKTTWAVLSGSTHRLSARGGGTTNGSCPLPVSDESPVSRSKTAAVKLSLDQRRRAIELSRQRALAATTKSACKRHHTAFQKLLQIEQRRKVQKSTDLERDPTLTSPRQNTATSPNVTTSTELSLVVEQVDLTTSVDGNATSPAVEQAPCMNGGSLEMPLLETPLSGNSQSPQHLPDPPHPTYVATNLPLGDEPKSTFHDAVSPPPAHYDAPNVSSISDVPVHEHTAIDSVSGHRNSYGSSSSNSGDHTVYTESEECSLKAHSEHWFHSIPRRSSKTYSSSVRAATPQRLCNAAPHAISRTSLSRDSVTKHEVYPHSLRSSIENPEGTYRSSFVDHSLPSFRKTRRTAHRSRVLSDTYSTPGWLGTERSLRDEKESLRPCHIDETHDATCLECSGEAPEDFYEDGGWDSEDDTEARTSCSHPPDNQRLLDRSHLAHSRFTSSHIHLDHPHRRNNRHRTRHASPFVSCHCERRSCRVSNHSLVESTDLDELNRNIVDLQSGIRRLAMLTSSRASEAELPTERILFPGQQAPVHLLNSTTSLGGSPRATWNDRPKLLDLGACAVQNTASVSAILPSNAPEQPPPSTRFQLQVPSQKSSVTIASSLGLTPSVEADANGQSTQVVSTTPEISSCRQKSPDSGNKNEFRPDQKIFFVAFEEGDPQRMQRKFDQLEARRAAEKAAAARTSESRRSQLREANASAEEAHQTKVIEKEKRTVVPHFNATNKEPSFSHSQNPYPVRSGSAVLSRSEANLPSAVRDPHNVWQLVANSRRVPPDQRLTGNSGGKAGTDAAASGPRGSGDGEAVETKEMEEDSRLCRSPHGSRKSGQPNGLKSESRLHSGLSLSSLHRLSAADSSSTCSAFSIAHSAHPKLFVKPKAKSNRMVIVNAIGHACLAGAVNEPMKQATLKELAATEGTHFMILFRDSRCQYRAVYSFDLELEELRLICGTGPRRITHEMANRFFKYNSGAKQFTEITSTNHLSPVVDAITIHDSLWTKGGAQSAALNLLSGRL